MTDKQIKRYYRNEEICKLFKAMDARLDISQSYSVIFRIIGKRFGIPEQRVSYILKSNGIICPVSGTRTRRMAVKQNERAAEQELAIMSEYRSIKSINRTMSPLAISFNLARKYGVRQEHVMAMVKEIRNHKNA